MDPWLQRLRHDLLKRALWPARDLRGLLDAKSATSADVRALRAGLLDLRDPQGALLSATRLWRLLRPDAPASLDAKRLDDLQNLLDEAERLVAALDPDTALARGAQPLKRALAAVLALEPAFDRLA